MGVSLFTSRIVLNTLGVVDFGIYNVVGGVVMMFSFLNSSMSSATQRFFSFELGKKDYDQLKKVFCMSVNIHAIIAVVIFILAETIGLWFLNAKLVIPAERMIAANWVYQFSILAFMLTIMGVPYNAMIIAHERMNVYAYVSIIEVVLKLVIVFMLVWFGFDKLKLYAVLVFGVAAIVWIIYKFYCKRRLPETKYRFAWDQLLYKTLMNYAGWNLFGNVAGVAMGQGVNILLNMFFGPAINAARAIAYQINSAVNGFVTNFQMAMNPQIVKSFATEDIAYMHQLIFRGAKYSFFLLFIIALPVLLETEIILKTWLKIVPDYTVLFTRLVLINMLIDCISGPLMSAAQATGKIKKYQAIVGGLLLLNLPASYFLLKLGMLPQTTMYVSIAISVLALYTRLKIISPLIGMSISSYIHQVVLYIIPVGLLSIIPSVFLMLSMDSGANRFLVILLTSIFSSIIFIYLFGLTRDEKQFVISKVSSISDKKIMFKK